MKTLSILICSLHTRREKFYKNLITELEKQLKEYKNSHYIQIVSIIDNKKMSVGHKRNQLLQSATGDYVCYIDDDDRISADYIDKIHTAIQSNDDCICFDVEVSIDFQTPMIAHFANYKENKNLKTHYERMPNHLMAVKTEIAKKAGFPEINFKEDDEYGYRISKMIKSINKIDKVLYYYDFNTQTTETQK
jgi:glycosyltransferase involved in cell wall biosynthesis